MLQKAFRLPAHTPLTNTRSLHTKNATIKYQKNDLAVSRFGFVISKKISKSAVERNRMKRQLRARIEASMEEIQKGYDMLCIIRKKIPDENKSEFDEIVARIKSTIR